jgi:hypothetical protein
MRLDRVILSSDLNPKYLDFWPIVSQAWRKLFDVPVVLALVAPPNPDLVRELQIYGSVVRLDPVPGIPLPNQAKMARYFVAAQDRSDLVTMTNDIDLLPLQREYYDDLLAKRPAYSLMTIGSELYTGPEQGKFTAGYLTCEGYTWRRLLHRDRPAWAHWINSFVAMRLFDDKEDISSTVHHEHPDTFSDESVLRAVLSCANVHATMLPRGYADTKERGIDRSDWPQQIDHWGLRSKRYVESHLLRPYRDHAARIKPLLDYLGIQPAILANTR